MLEKLQPSSFKLPNTVAQLIDIGHIQHELSLIDEHLNQAAIKDPNRQVVVKTSPKLSDLLSANNIDITTKSQRALLIGSLEELRKSAPVVNISFSSEAGDEFIEQIVNWFRTEVHQHCLVVVGLDPSIGIGSIVRTANKIFDFSLKNQLKATHELLEDRVKQLNVEEVS